jgi:serine/threonine protein kinase
LDSWALGVLTWRLLNQNSFKEFPWSIARVDCASYREFFNNPKVAFPAEEFSLSTIKLLKRLLVVNPQKRADAKEAVRVIKENWCI